jgi:hypothetical protein
MFYDDEAVVMKRFIEKKYYTLRRQLRIVQFTVDVSEEHVASIFRDEE